MDNTRRALWFLAVFLSAACAPRAEGALPTLVELPTDPPPITAAAARPTLPPSWTPTPTETATWTPSPTFTLTVTPSLTITDTPTRTPTPEPLPPTADVPLTNLLALALQFTPLPSDYVVPDFGGPEVTLNPQNPPLTPLSGGTANCQYFPSSGFAAVFAADPSLPSQIGCPVGFPPQIVAVAGAEQLFESGRMIWVSGAPSQIYVLYNNNSYQNFADSFLPGIDPESGGESPPSGRLEPVRGFGKVWRSLPTVRNGLGWALGPETSATITLQSFERGLMLYVANQTAILVLVANPDGTTGTWRAVAGQF